jgi:hypothetical protein
MIITTKRFFVTTLVLAALITIVDCASAHAYDNEDQPVYVVYDHVDPSKPHWEHVGTFFGYNFFISTVSNTGETTIRVRRICDPECEQAAEKLIKTAVTNLGATLNDHSTTLPKDFDLNQLGDKVVSALQSNSPGRMQEATAQIQDEIARIHAESYRVQTENTEAEKRRVSRNKLHICLGVGLLVVGVFALMMYRRQRTKNRHPLF